MLQEYNWTQKDLKNTEYSGKYVTHDFVNKNSISRALETEENDLELGSHKLSYDGKTMDVELQVTRDYAQFFYDKTFEEELGDEDFHEVITHFLTPERWRPHSALEDN